MLLQTNSYVVPKNRRPEHERLMRRFRQTLARLGCDQFEVYEQVAANWGGGENGRYVQIMRFRDRKHQLHVQSMEKSDPAAQALIAEFCDLVNFPYQQQQGLFAVGFYSSTLPVVNRRARRKPGTADRLSQTAPPVEGHTIPPAAAVREDAYSQRSAEETLARILGNAAGQEFTETGSPAAEEAAAISSDELPAAAGETINPANTDVMAEASADIIGDEDEDVTGELPDDAESEETVEWPTSSESGLTAPEAVETNASDAAELKEVARIQLSEEAEEFVEWEPHLPLSPVDDVTTDSPVGAESSPGLADSDTLHNGQRTWSQAIAEDVGQSDAAATAENSAASESSALPDIPPQLLEFDDSEFALELQNEVAALMPKDAPELGEPPVVEEIVDLSAAHLDFDIIEGDETGDLSESIAGETTVATDEMPDFSSSLEDSSVISDGGPSSAVPENGEEVAGGVGEAEENQTEPAVRHPADQHVH